MLDLRAPWIKPTTQTRSHRPLPGVLPPFVIRSNSSINLSLLRFVGRWNWIGKGIARRNGRCGAVLRAEMPAPLLDAALQARLLFLQAFPGAGVLLRRRRGLRHHNGPEGPAEAQGTLRGGRRSLSHRPHGGCLLHRRGLPRRPRQVRFRLRDRHQGPSFLSLPTKFGPLYVLIGVLQVGFDPFFFGQFLFFDGLFVLMQTELRRWLLVSFRVDKSSSFMEWVNKNFIFWV